MAGNKMKIFLSLRSFLILYPVILVLVTEFLWLLKITINPFSGWLISVILFFFIWYMNKENLKKILLPFLGIFLFSILYSILFIFQDSYDTSVCHRPAMLMLADGWNPIYQPTMQHITSFNWDFTRISINHIVYQPKTVWVFCAAMYDMTGIVTSEIILFVFCISSLFLYSRRFCEKLYGVSKLISFFFALSIIAMPQISQALVGQLDYVVYSSTVIAIFSAILFIKTRERDDLLGSFASLLLLFTTKINGLMFAVVIFFFMSAIYLYLERKNWKEKLKKISVVLSIFIGLTLILNWNPYITNSIYYGGPLYPAHSFNKEKLKDIKDLTSDFVGNADSDQMGHVGRFSYAWLNKYATLQYYCWKTGKIDFYPRFNVAEGCEGYKGIFRFLMLLGILSLFFSKREMGDFAILLPFLLALMLPTKYIGYSRYSQQIWCVPFVMLLSFYSTFNSNTVKWKRIFVTVVPVIFVFYAFLVLGRFAACNLYELYRSERMLKTIENMESDAGIYTLNSIPPPTWNGETVAAHNISSLTCKHWYSSLMDKEKLDSIRLKKAEEKIDLPLKKNEYILLYHHGVMLQHGDKKEFLETQKVQIPSSPGTVRTVPYKELIKDFPWYFATNVKKRIQVLLGK